MFLLLPPLSTHSVIWPCRGGFHQRESTKDPGGTGHCTLPVSCHMVYRRESTKDPGGTGHCILAVLCLYPAIRSTGGNTLRIREGLSTISWLYPAFFLPVSWRYPAIRSTGGSPPRIQGGLGTVSCLYPAIRSTTVVPLNRNKQLYL
jgi:hypothetical protein